jgi:hypothetical protein
MSVYNRYKRVEYSQRETVERKTTYVIPRTSLLAVQNLTVTNNGIPSKKCERFDFTNSPWPVSTELEIPE